jgi:hypothetical protein
MNDPQSQPELLTLPIIQQALSYWQSTAQSLDQMRADLPDRIPGTADFDGLDGDVSEALTAFLMAANQLVGHYVMLASRPEHQAQAPAPERGQHVHPQQHPQRSQPVPPAERSGYVPVPNWQQPQPPVAPPQQPVGNWTPEPVRWG